MKREQHGGFLMGMIVGLLVGLALALGVALYVTKVPVPFVNKVPQRTAEEEAAQAERNKNWDPNAPLGGKATRPATSSSGVVTAPPAVAAPGSPPVAGPSAPASIRDPAAILADRPTTPATTSPVGGSATEAFIYFVQAGAYGRSQDAEQQRARLAMLGMDAAITEREQSGRTVYRVRVGPFEQRDQADAAKTTLDGAGIESAMVRVQR